MKSNKTLWRERTEAGKSKLDVALETQRSADEGRITENIEKYNSKQRTIKVDSQHEAKVRASHKQDKKEADDLKQIDADAETERKAAEAQERKRTESDSSKLVT